MTPSEEPTNQPTKQIQRGWVTVVGGGKQCAEECLTITLVCETTSFYVVGLLWFLNNRYTQKIGDASVNTVTINKVKN